MAQPHGLRCEGKDEGADAFVTERGLHLAVCVPVQEAEGVMMGTGIPISACGYAM